MGTFKLVSTFQPRGDQPKAIAELVQGVKKGLKHQVLLGVTGSGKSLPPDEPIWVYQATEEGLVPALTSIGPFVDQLMRERPVLVSHDDTETVLLPESGVSSYYTLSLNPQTLESEIRPVQAVHRHRAPSTLWTVKSACGRSVRVTGDHNLWVLRDGHLHLLETQKLQVGDYLPLPQSLPASEDGLDTDLCARLLAQWCGAQTQQKRLPPFWPQLNHSQLALFLAAYFTSDGAVEWDKVTVSTTSYPLAAELAYALTRFGIWAHIEEGGRCTLPSPPEDGPYYRLIIAGGDQLRRFADHINFLSERKRLQLDTLLRKEPPGNEQVIPVAGKEIRLLRMALNLSEQVLACYTGCTPSYLSLLESEEQKPSRDLLEKLIMTFESEVTKQEAWDLLEYIGHLKQLQAVHWSPVLSIVPEPSPCSWVYDLSIPENETFLAGFGGLFVHNTFTMAHTIAQVQKPTLVLAPNKTLAAQLYTEFRELFPENAVEYFVSYYDYYQPEAYIPTTDTYIEKDAAINDRIDKMRHSATRSLLERRDVIVVASVSCIYGLGSPKDYHNMLVLFQAQMEVPRDEILAKLVEIQYQRNDMDFHRGTFRIRGDVVDIFPAYEEEKAIRIEFFGDYVESISEIDPLRGETLRKLNKIAIYPGSHYVTSRENLLRAIKDIEAELEERLRELIAQNKLLEAQRLEQRTRFDIEMLKEMGYCQGIENYSRHLDGRKAGEPPWVLLNYFPPDFLLFIDESHVSIPQLGGMYRGDRSRKETLVEYGFRLPSALDNRPLNFEEFEHLVHQVIYVSATPGDYEIKKSKGRVVEQIIRPTGLMDPEIKVKPVRGQVDDLLEEIRKRVKRKERVLVTTLTKRMAEDLTEYYQDLGIKVKYLHSDIDTLQRHEIIRDLRLGKFDVLIGINLLREGLDIPEVSLVAILDADKEGYLRSERSLIQTIGRAARHVRGQVIMYCDTMTKSLQKAISETNRRREIQRAYNEAHGITPASVLKTISQSLYALYEADYVTAPIAAEEEEVYLSTEELNKLIIRLKKEMKAAADKYDFEKAAEIRDRIFRLEGKELELPR